MHKTSEKSKKWVRFGKKYVYKIFWYLYGTSWGRNLLTKQTFETKLCIKPNQQTNDAILAGLINSEH